ncbi:MAG TPA: YtxH domain-containing protein [Gemmatimonadaceae bacterium]|nr:YtxH domain-containing protein [Gemmatimonadaceae bacterium]
MTRYEEIDDEPIVIVQRHGRGMSTFLWGMAIGAGIALLYAPRSGEETRRDLRHRARRVQGAAQDAAGELKESMTGRYQTARRSVEERLDSAKRALEIRKEQASQAIRAGREAADQARRELEARLAETRAAYHAGGEVVRESQPLPPVADDRDSDTRDAAGT